MAEINVLFQNQNYWRCFILQIRNMNWNKKGRHTLIWVSAMGNRFLQGGGNHSAILESTNSFRFLIKVKASMIIQLILILIMITTIKINNLFWFSFHTISILIHSDYNSRLVNAKLVSHHYIYIYICRF